MDNCRISAVAPRTTPLPAELTVYHAGSEECAAGHRWAGVRDHYLVHYVLGGCGVFRWRGVEHRLAAGAGFTIFPNDYADYEADHEDPWHYCWVGFHGAAVAHDLETVGVTGHSPVFSYDRDSGLRDCVLECAAALHEPAGRDFALRSLGYRLFHLLARQQAPRPANARAAYVAAAIAFLNRNFSHQLSIAEVASYVGIDRRYLAGIFRDATGTSPQEYLLQLRIAKARELLHATDLSVAAIAQSVGYTDALYFSRLYHRKTGAAPSTVRTG